MIEINVDVHHMSYNLPDEVHDLAQYAGPSDIVIVSI